VLALLVLPSVAAVEGGVVDPAGELPAVLGVQQRQVVDAGRARGVAAAGSFGRALGWACRVM